MVNSDRPQKFHVRLMRRSVDYLGRHAIVRQLFFAVGFFTIRFVFPLQYLLLRELMDCKSVLDLGCGHHSMVPIIPTYIEKTGVELFEPYYQEALRKKRHHAYIQEDVMKVDFKDKTFDAVVLLDVIEHLSKEEGLALIKNMERWARKKVIVFTPNGFLHQDCYDDNPYMKHKSGWTYDEFSHLGFKVRGVRGFKFLKKDDHHHEEIGGTSFLETLSDLTQIISYHFPKTAFQLFCVKKLSAPNE